MLNNNSGFVKLALSILLFPTFFQRDFLLFSWGAGDPMAIMAAKRLFLLLPVATIILACWLSVASILTVVIRPNRQEYIRNLFITWWDLGKSIAHFWGGFFKFALNLAVTSIAFTKVAILAFWSLAQEIIFIPFRFLGRLGRGIASTSIPWIAVVLTLFWCLIEAIIFTYVTTPLVVDTFSNITGDTLTENVVRIPLFVFMLFIVLGSYAVLSTLVDSISDKKVSSIAGIAAIEMVVIFVEVMFLYREFVDALAPWFAQYSETFELGIVGTITISIFVWFGIRSLSWFLFASHGTPTIMSIIQGKGLQLAENDNKAKAQIREFKPLSAEYSLQIKQDMEWVQEAGKKLLTSFVLPPLQVVGAGINFCTLLINGDHLFVLPFEQLTDLDITSGNQNLTLKQENRPAKTTKIESTKSGINRKPVSLGELHDVKS